jgi:hypothetical protein
MGMKFSDIKERLSAIRCSMIYDMNDMMLQKLCRSKREEEGVTVG